MALPYEFECDLPLDLQNIQLKTKPITKNISVTRFQNSPVISYKVIYICETQVKSTIIQCAVVEIKICVVSVFYPFAISKKDINDLSRTLLC
jgi:hypothetical protein